MVATQTKYDLLMINNYNESQAKAKGKKKYLKTKQNKKKY